MSKHEDTRAVWGASPAGTAFADGAAPGTPEFFERVMLRRSTYEQPWLSQVVPFESFCGKRVLEVGCGAGYDAYTMCGVGAAYTGVDITPENVQRTRSHLQLFGYQPQVQEADAEALSFPDKSFDVVYSNGVLHHTSDISASFREAYRVLGENGDFWVILYHKNSVYYRLSLAFVEHFLRLGFFKRSLAERLAMDEFTTSASLPLVNVYSRRAVVEMMRASGFLIQGTWVRKLVREDLPAFGLLRGLYARVPQTALDAIGRRWGWYVIAHGVKR